MKKRLYLLLTLVLTALLLAGCGGLKGTYTPADASMSTEISSIRFDGSKAVLSIWGYKVGGSYKVQGDTLELNYTLLGNSRTQSFAFSQKGNSILIDGVEYVKSAGGGSSKSILIAVLALLVLAAIAVAVYFLVSRRKAAEEDDFDAEEPKKKGKPAFLTKLSSRRADDEDEDDEEEDFDDFDDEEEDEPEEKPAPAEKPAPEDDEDEGVRVWKPETKPEPVEEPEPEEAVAIRPDRCCICGKSLEDGYTTLARLPSGEEARIDRNCHKALYILSTTKDRSEFNKACGYLESRMDHVDPIVSLSLEKYIEKEEARMDSEAEA